MQLRVFSPVVALATLAACDHLASAQQPVYSLAAPLPQGAVFRLPVLSTVPDRNYVSGLEPAPPVPVPAAGAPDAAAATNASSPCADSCGDGVDWSKVPPVRIIPRLGNFPIPPKGCGYYSLFDRIHGERRDGPPKYGYPAFGLIPPPFFDADFRYLDSPENKDADYADPLKRVRLGDDWLFSTGGDLRDRHVVEQHSRLGLPDNVYNLMRARVYGDLWYRDAFRVYGEFISAHSLWHDLSPLAIDVNKADIQNLFVDAKLLDLGEHPVYLRVGRQELLLGSQRLISTLDWANTRRTFQGVRAFRQGEKFDVDLFWVQPVIPNPNRLDSVDNNQNFAGLWTTYRPEKGHFLDFYYLFLDNTTRTRQLDIDRSPYNVHTLGARYSGDRNNFLWDVELALQFGERGQQDILAGMASAGAGYNFAGAPLNPTVWLYYDYASGSRNPGQGTYSTFNQLFAFGHYYLGWIDQVGRQNIHDLNVHTFLYPAKWMTVWLQYHCFWLDQRRDALYNAAGAPIRRSATGAAGNDVGNEIDFVLNFHLSKHSDILAGYSKLFGGDFLEQTRGSTGSTNSEFFFVQYSYRW